MSVTVDFHCHILPRLDDGSRSAEESLQMLRMSAEQGIRQVILTPHFYPQHTTPRRFLEKRSRSVELLMEKLTPDMDLPALRCGAEVYYYPQMSHSEELTELTIQGTNCILVEMPFGPWSDRMYRELGDIYHNLGLVPIVAHVDRYLGRFFDHGIPSRLADLPVLVQANAEFFLSGGRGMTMLQKQQIHLLGSDCHNLNDRRPNLGDAAARISRKLGRDALRWIRSNERRVLG